MFYSLITLFIDYMDERENCFDVDVGSLQYHFDLSERESPMCRCGIDHFGDGALNDPLVYIRTYLRKSVHYLSKRVCICVHREKTSSERGVYLFFVSTLNV